MLNLEALLAFLRAAFGGPGGALVVSMDISTPHADIATMAALHSVADVVLT